MTQPFPKTVFRPKALCLDIETTVGTEVKLTKIGAWRVDTGQHAHFQGSFSTAELRAELDRLSAGSAFLLGHNITGHDLPVLKSLFPDLALFRLRVVDTLWLSPLAFPQNPYHSLVKDYKLIKDSGNDPLKDAQLSFRLFEDQMGAFEQLLVQSPEELACYHYLLAGVPGADYDRLFSVVREAPKPRLEEVRRFLLNLAGPKVCGTRLRQLLAEDLDQADSHVPLAYVLAWLRVSGGNSVLPPWVLYQIPRTRELIRELRDTACGRSDCGYCSRYHDVRAELERFFNFPAFRAEPQNAAGGSLQEDIVKAGMAREHLLAILPTGGGKSLCYQLPALSRYWRDGSLTIIVSPLQSLMKDQVDNLVKQGIFCGAALNGLLSMPERKDVLEKVRLGDIGILLVSPEQFRNRGFTEAIKHRQIGAWVFDEAHCLSKWGHDFRTDYLYVSRFIREHYGDPLAPINCFTATAKLDVIQDLESHFREMLGITLRRFEGGHERTNLHFEVLSVKKAEKFPLIHTLLEKELKDVQGGAVVFTARRASAEEIAGFLKDMGWVCAHFHAGLDPGLKKEIQKAFIDGELRVIVATNAFGMGVDKPDVRLVIHAEIPGSLENYLQEAGRAGRDRSDARCILLYDEEDVETQFSLAARSRLSRQDIAEILRVLRRRSKRIKSDTVVVTAGEILTEDAMETAIEVESPDADTKVKTAIAWLERRRFLERDENQTRVFPASLKVASLDEVEKRLRKANLSEEVRKQYLNLVAIILNADADEGISTDTLMVESGLSSDECIRILHQLEELQVLSNDIGMTVLLRKGAKDSSQDRLRRVTRLEAGLLELLPELAPDADQGDWQDMHLRQLCQELRQRTECELLPDELLTLLRTMSRAFGESQAMRAMFEVRMVKRDYLRVRLRRSWAQIREIAAKRRDIAQRLLQYFLGRLPSDLKGVDLRVECRMGELTQVLKDDLVLAGRLKNVTTALEQGLLYLHDNHVLILDRGRTVFRSAMTIRLLPDEAKRRFVQSDYEPLWEHYREKNFQVHVIQEYARKGLAKLGDALAYVAAYFRWPKTRFIREYFANRREILDLATTEESYRRIVSELRHPVQERLVSEKTDVNRLILAGPGSGKTRVIVHRVAYLLRVSRVPPDSIIVLTFNRAAAYEVRRRLHALVGNDAYGVTVLTYHALALRLTGTSLAVAAEAGQEIVFDEILQRAIDLLEGNAEIGDDPDELRERLLRGYRFVLVDEYQDIDALQYRLIGALTGRTLKDRDAKLTIMAVGDDDQNIYAFRQTNVEFIRRFAADYEAETEYLIENYRSTAHIISAANAVIQGSLGRLKADYPIRINHARRDQPGGGRWERLDPVAKGRVHILEVPPDRNRETQVAMRELERLQALAPNADWSDFAVLGRTHAALEPVRAYCEWAGIPYRLAETHRSGGRPELHQTREGRSLIQLLRTHKRKLLRNGALREWVRKRFDRSADNPWLELLEHCVLELEDAWRGMPIPVGQALDWIYEYGSESRHQAVGRITLSTVHAAKGREFKHVLILDGDDWRNGEPGEERRLYYVAMTRARETLTLCEAIARPNPSSHELEDDEFIVRTPQAEFPEPQAALNKIYVQLGLAHVDLGFAGRKPAADPVHRAIAMLKVGDSLDLARLDERWVFKNRRGLIVGRLSQKFEIPAGEIEDVRIGAIVHRSKRQCRGTEWESRCQVDNWEVVLCQISIRPERTQRLAV